jgi:hypothetical protein
MTIGMTSDGESELQTKPKKEKVLKKSFKTIWDY